MFLLTLKWQWFTMSIMDEGERQIVVNKKPHSFNFLSSTLKTFLRNFQSWKTKQQQQKQQYLMK